MTLFRCTSFLAGLLLLTTGRAVALAETNRETPEFKDVYEVIRANAAGVSEADLNRAAVEGLLSELGSKVTLVTGQAPTNAAGEAALLSRTTCFDGGIAYLRVARVADGLAKAVKDAFQTLGTTNKLAGLILDLRYANGNDYAAVAATADLFVARSQPLLNWGGGMVSSQEKSNAIQMPVAVLVNSETAAAAEALAAVLRSRGAGLILGGKTAGRAMVTKDFPLKAGGKLRIAVEPIALGDGSQLSAKGVQPDIDVLVSAEDERAYFADGFYAVRKGKTAAGGSGSVTNQAAGTNSARRARLNEAELVREHREGMDRDVEPAHERPPDPEIRFVNDPALARALDLLKGLALVRPSRA